MYSILNPLPLRNKKDDLLLKNVGTSGIWRDPGVLSLCFLLCRRPAIDGDKLDTSALVQWITCLASSISRTVPFVRVQYSAKEEERGEDGRQKVQSQLVAGRVGLLQVCRSVLRDTLQGLLGVTVVQGM